MTQDNVPTSAVLGTTIREPSFTAGEAEMLLFVLERSRAQFAWKVGGLDAAALAKPQPPSAMTLGGLIKHLAWVEDWRTAVWVTGEPIVEPWRSHQAEFDADSGWEWSSAADDPPQYLYGLWRDAVERSRAAITMVLADGGLDQPSKWTTRSGRSPNLRRSLYDLHDEYARHVGHADLLREAIDGLTGEDPPQP